MIRPFRLTNILLVLAFAAFTFLSPNPARAASAAEINRDANKALQSLYKKSSAAKALGEKAKAILVFPGITKGGFMVGGQYGEGALMNSVRRVGHRHFAGHQAVLRRPDHAQGRFRGALDGERIGRGPS